MLMRQELPVNMLLIYILHFLLHENISNNLIPMTFCWLSYAFIFYCVNNLLFMLPIETFKTPTKACSFTEITLLKDCLIFPHFIQFSKSDSAFIKQPSIHMCYLACMSYKTKPLNSGTEDIYLCFANI